MKRLHLLLLMVAVSVAVWLATNQLGDVFFGVEDVPIIGDVGVAPFSWVEGYAALFGGLSVVLVYLLFGRKTK